MSEKESLTRRDFLKRAVLAVMGIAAGYSLYRLFKEKVCEPEHSDPLKLPEKSNKSTYAKKNNIKKGYDVVIVGCGMAGAVAGLTALKRNLNVCIVERNEREFIGRKICGEMTPESVVKWLKNEFNLSINCHLLKGMEICSSSGHTSRITGPTCMIDRWQVQQAMLENLLDRGAEVYHGTVRSPILESSVKGVKTKDSTFYGTVTIDCSGVSSVLRRKLISEPQLLGIAYKENLILEEPVEMDYAVLYLDKNILPSGYMWCFPKSEYELNVGAGGLEQGGAALGNHLEKAIEALGITSRIKRREFPGFGLVPLGRPLPSMVYPGALVCGDAASHVNPLTGGGIAPAVTAGYLAASTSAEAVENNDVSTKGMWKYNYDFARKYGIKHAALVVARDFLVSLSDKELAYFLENVVTDDDLNQLMRGKNPFQESGILKIVLDNWRRPGLLYRMYRAFRLIRRIRNHYEQYPEGPEEFSSWREILDQYLSPHNR
jgi:digeranylgeranylglycerophospholipid reductase